MSVFAPGNEQGRFKVPVGVRPNGLSFDPRRGLLLAANVGSPDEAGSFTLSVVDITRQKMIHSILVPGRTRWTVFDPREDLFYVNIADPPRILVVEAAHPDKVARELTVPAAGPHGLDLDADGQILYCACDAGKTPRSCALGRCHPAGSILERHAGCDLLQPVLVAPFPDGLAAHEITWRTSSWMWWSN